MIHQIIRTITDVAPVKAILDDLYRTAHRNEFVFVMCNQTSGVIRRIESHNNSDNWPFEDLQPKTVVEVRLQRKNFSFAAKYHLTDLGTNVILAASSPLLGGDKVGLKSPAQGTPCREVWDQMDDGHDKSGGSARAFIKSAPAVGSKIWVFDIG